MLPVIRVRARCFQMFDILFKNQMKAHTDYKVVRKLDFNQSSSNQYRKDTVKNNSSPHEGTYFKGPRRLPGVSLYVVKGRERSG